MPCPALSTLWTSALLCSCIRCCLYSSVTPCLSARCLQVQDRHHVGMQHSQQHNVGAEQPAGFLPAGFPGVPMLGLLPAPALGLLTSALAVPGMVLGSILETNALPAPGDSSSSSSSPSGEYIQPAAGSAGQCRTVSMIQRCTCLLVGELPCEDSCARGAPCGCLGKLIGATDCALRLLKIYRIAFCLCSGSLTHSGVCRCRCTEGAGGAEAAAVPRGAVFPGVHHQRGCPEH